MLDNLIKYLDNKKVLILGFGREGKSTYKLIRKYLNKKHIYISDKELVEDENLKQDKNISYISGDKYLENLKDYDLIIKSPGISLAKEDTTKYKGKITSQLELLLEFFSNYTIGITGTKGKSTTSSLIYTILKEQNIKTMLLGNIGTPVFEYIEDIEKDMVIVLEMSSHQLEYMKKSPNIAILLNIYEEHLDYYKSLENYAKAKCNIYIYQKDTDYFLYNSDNEILEKMVKKPKAVTYKVSFSKEKDVYLKEDKIYFKDKELYNKNEKRNLQGDYNLNNIMFVLAVSEILNLNKNKTIKTINEFKTLKHRLEFVGKYEDVIYYDNSIGTIPKATIEAIETLKEVDSLIIGGMDRGIDYSEFIKYLNNSKIRNIICMPKTGHNIAKEIRDKNTYIVNTMEEAVKVAKEKTRKGNICLLSPTAASYGYFKNFEEKGDLFIKLVRCS